MGDDGEELNDGGEGDEEDVLGEEEEEEVEAEGGLEDEPEGDDGGGEDDDGGEDDGGDEEDAAEDEQQEETQQEHVWGLDELEALRLELLCSTTVVVAIRKLKRGSASFDERYKLIGRRSDDDSDEHDEND